MFDWLLKSKEWAFSGVGVAIVAGIITWLRRKRKTDSGIHQSQRSGAHSINIQVGRDINLGTPELKVESKVAGSAELGSPHQVYHVAQTDSHNKPFTRRTARELLSLYHDAYSSAQGEILIQPFKGQWIAVEGQLIDIQADDQGFTVGLHIEPALSRPSGFPARYLVNARFGAVWRSEMLRLKKADVVHLQGKISNSQNGHQLYLVECELVQAFKAPQQAGGDVHIGGSGGNLGR